MWKRLADCVQVITGYPFRGKVHPEEGGKLAVIQIKDIDAGGAIDLGSALRIQADSRFERHLLRAGDVLLQSRGSHHPSAVFDGSVDAIGALAVHILRPCLDVLQPEFLSWYLNHPKTQDRLRDLARGSSVAFIAKNDIENFTVPVPPVALQEKVASVAQLRKQEACLVADLERLRGEYINNLLMQIAASDSKKRV